MKTTHKLIIAFLISLTCLTSELSAQTAPDEDYGLMRLSSWLCGEFSSGEQAKKDTSYFDIYLCMTRIWPDRKDGIWLYVEQAMATKRESPYRQRVYRLNRVEGETFSSEIYTLVNPKEVIGLQQDTAKRSFLTFEKITLKEGCTVFLSESNDVFTGGTDEQKCPSDLRGATYATTKIRLTERELVSWDQGFDAAGNQVWGATKGGYIFIKK